MRLSFSTFAEGNKDQTRSFLFLVVTLKEGYYILINLSWSF